ncbi:MAG: metallophosphoesterase [Bacteroidia bacterium]|nr:metallophosphoesterase [Bacteroidia bacterium]
MKKYVFLFWAFFVSCTVFASDPIKIAVVTDLHYLSPQLADGKQAHKMYEKSTGRNTADLHEVLDTVLARIMAQNMDVLLISGDLTNHGERRSHLDLIEKLKRVQRNGTKIMVAPGNHDVNIPNARAYTGEKPTPVTSISEEEFAEWYAPFGYGNALKRDEGSLSYLAEIDENTWLLCFDTNRYREHTTNSVTAGRIVPQTMSWALDILREAREKNITVLGMMHHGLVEHMPYQSTFFSGYLIEDWQKNAEILADAGLKVVFTGHFHSNDVSLLTSPAGNTIYDVQTASLAQYPFAYRVMELSDNKLSIDTRFITSVARNPHLEEQARTRLETITRRVAKNRIENLGIPFPAENGEALVELIVKMNLLHVRGDEVVDDEMKKAINRFAELLGSEELDSDFQLDFPPADNKLVINLGAAI